MIQVNNIKQTIINDNFKTIQDVLSYYNFVEDSYDYDFRTFKYRLQYININIEIPTDRINVKRYFW